MSQKAFFDHAQVLGLERGTNKYQTGRVRLPDPQANNHTIISFEYDPTGWKHKDGWVNVAWHCNETSYHSTMKMDRFLNLKKDDIKAMAEMVEQTDKAWHAAKESGKVLKFSIHEIIKGEIQL